MNLGRTYLQIILYLRENCKFFRTAGYVWLTELAFIGRTTVGRLSDHYMDGRYDSLRDTVSYDIIHPVGWYGAWVLVGIAIIWGFS